MTEDNFWSLKAYDEFAPAHGLPPSTQGSARQLSRLIRCAHLYAQEEKTNEADTFCNHWQLTVTGRSRAKVDTLVERLLADKNDLKMTQDRVWHGIAALQDPMLPHPYFVALAKHCGLPHTIGAGAAPEWEARKLDKLAYCASLYSMRDKQAATTKEHCGLWRLSTTGFLNLPWTSHYYTSKILETVRPRLSERQKADKCQRVYQYLLDLQHA